MPETSTRKLSRTEITLRVKGIMADALSLGVTQIREPLYLRAGLGLSAPQVGLVVTLIESAFGMPTLVDAHTEEFRTMGTVGDLISLVEGQVGGIA